ncbi:MAG: 3-methyladenine DNA glycosylase, partial [Symploca sp. SIO1C4]|nr:3-methyladenine DNA glycosylase [Symploca sp. SIO1C4]
MSETKPFKLYYDAELAERLGGMLTAVYPAFDTASFVAFVVPKLDALEFKGRIACFAEGLHLHLPEDYPTAVGVLSQILGVPMADEEGMFNDGYHLWPVAYFVEAYGVEHFDESMKAMYAITQRHTA